MELRKFTDSKAFRNILPEESSSTQVHIAGKLQSTRVLNEYAIGRLTQHLKIFNGAPIYSPHHMSLYHCDYLERQDLVK